MTDTTNNSQNFIGLLTEVIEANHQNSQFGVNELANTMGLEWSTLPIYATDLERLKESWYILQEQGVKMIYPGHGNAFPISKIMEKK